jgi:hypothetical protein
MEGEITTYKARRPSSDTKVGRISMFTGLGLFFYVKCMHVNVACSCQQTYFRGPSINLLRPICGMYVMPTYLLGEEVKEIRDGTTKSHWSEVRPGLPKVKLRVTVCASL